eukprot:481466-Prorocentrum_minimum.AAC.1
MISIAHARDKYELFIFYLQLDGVFEDSMGFTYMFENLGQSVDPDPVRLIVEGSLISYECNGVNDREISMDILRAITSGTQSPHLPPELMAVITLAGGNYSDVTFIQHEDEVRGDREARVPEG